jgi:hypothetical protein
MKEIRVMGCHPVQVVVEVLEHNRPFAPAFLSAVFTQTAVSCTVMIKRTAKTSSILGYWLFLFVTIANAPAIICLNRKGNYAFSFFPQKECP